MNVNERLELTRKIQGKFLSDGFVHCGWRSIIFGVDVDFSLYVLGSCCVRHVSVCCVGTWTVLMSLVVGEIEEV